MNTAEKASTSKIKVRILKGESTANEFDFIESFTVGRSEKCQVKILDQTISRCHGEIYFKENQWWLKDLQSSNGIFIDDVQIQEIPIQKPTIVELGKDGPQILLEVAESPKHNESITQYIKKISGDITGENVGEHTRMIRQAIQVLQKKQSRKYFRVILILSLLFLIAGAFAFYKHIQINKQKEVAQNIFYSMKTLEVKLAKLEIAISNDRQGKLSERKKIEDNYNELIGILDIYNKKLPLEDRLILKTARKFGECEINMPSDFTAEVKKYIKKWQSTRRYKKAITRAIREGYVEPIVKEMLNHELTPQFFYLALQESDFNPDTCGTKTDYGYAKGIWQFIPGTAEQYGLKTGKLFDARLPDPEDERHDFAKSTHAAARYIRDIYTTKAQGSGLLVMASYNWGQGNVNRLIQQLPENPRMRNFWNFFEKFHNDIPTETYNYIFYIFSASVIGEDPQLFGFDFENPIAAALTRMER